MIDCLLPLRAFELTQVFGVYDLAYLQVTSQVGLSRHANDQGLSKGFCSSGHDDRTSPVL